MQPNYLSTRNRWLAYVAANPTPMPAALAAFTNHQPRVLPQPKTPTQYARLSWLAAAFVAWVLLGTLLAKVGWQPMAPPANSPMRAQR